MELPGGTRIITGDETNDRVDIVDQTNHLSWTIRFFDNLHMDLRSSMRFHLEKSIETQTKALFEHEFWKGFKQNTTSMRPITQEDPNWSPVIDIEYKDLGTTSKTSTTALLVVYRKAYRPGEQIVVGRLCIPVRRGLIEIVVEAGDKGAAAREGALVMDMCKDNVMTTEMLQAMLKTREFDANRYDDQFPFHCLSRVRRAIHWLLEDSKLVVTEPRERLDSSPNAEVMLTHLGCTFRPPPRFLYCPNLSTPGSNKQKFCRATLGGSFGVHMLVISVWYTHSYAPHLRKRGNASLRQIAHHGAMSIHRAQSFLNIHVSVEDVPVSRRSSWLGGHTNKDAVLTVVDCEEAGGIRCQNTIGWIREHYSDRVYLIYYADTHNIDRNEVRTELLDSLFSVRTLEGLPYSGRRRSTLSVWNVNSMAITESTNSV